MLDHCRAGTPVYMAPEVFRREYGVQSDMWSLGMMLYHFISQRFPFWSVLAFLPALLTEMPSVSLR